jgi:Crp-like helix-turn-helix domain
MVTEEMPKNKILAGLPIQERNLILPSCELVRLNLGDHIDEAGKPINFLHFPLISAISITSIRDLTHMVEVTITGKEGCSGSSVVLGDDRSLCTAMVQIPGTAIRVQTSTLLEHLPRLRYLRSALSRHTFLLMRNAIISVGCSTYHTVPQRLARWLKAHWHRTGIESFPFSVQFLSAQVGAEPHIVNEVLEQFQRLGIVKNGHNSVTISDQDALAKQACECYELAKKATEEYMVALTEIVRTHESP